MATPWQAKRSMAVGKNGQQQSAKKPVQIKKNALQLNKGVRKNDKVKSKKTLWASKINQLASEKQITEASKAAPLKHFEMMQDTLAHITTELDTTKVPTKADENRKKVVSARGRAAALNEQRAFFKTVMRHPAFRKDPINAIHAHVTHKYDKDNK